MINVKLLEQALNHVTDNPGEWEQRTWLTRRGGCDTAGCIAGWTAMLAGGRPQFFDSWERESSRVVVEGKSTPVSDFATEKLGLTENQADALFHSENNLRDLWEIAHAFAGEIMVPPEVKQVPPRMWSPFEHADWLMGNVG